MMLSFTGKRRDLLNCHYSPNGSGGGYRIRILGFTCVPTIDREAYSGGPVEL